MRLLLSLVLALFALSAHAQEFPRYTRTTVNDFAGLLTSSERRRLRGMLTDLRERTDVEMTVATLAT